jgi:Fur family ferric uptake transcriptional regulator
MARTAVMLLRIILVRISGAIGATIGRMADGHERSMARGATPRRHARSSPSWAEHARRELRRSGHRAGGAREEVVDLLAAQDCCLSAQDMHDQLRAAGGRAVALASVYRALDVLAQLRLVHRVDVGGVACYEPAVPTGEHHHHAICDRCGKMDAFEDPELERLLDGVAARLGYDAGGHDLVLHGACPDCAGR